MPKGINNVTLPETEDQTYSMPFQVFQVEMENAMSAKVRYHQHENNMCLTIYHEGHLHHGGPPLYRESFFKRISNLGCDLLWFNMPLMADNPTPEMLHSQFGKIKLQGHEQLQLIADNETPYLYYFFEPLVKMINYTTSQKEYNHINMIGHSGGGWTTHVYSAIDERIQSSYAHAGSLPLFILSTPPAAPWSDFEQNYIPLLDVANYMDLYVMATSNGRKQVQLLNNYDPCCFSGSASKVYVPAVQKKAQIFDGEFRQVIHPTNISHDMHKDTKDFIIQDIKKQISK